jgi:hypothetical protein
MATFEFPQIQPEKLQAITERLVQAGWVEKAAVTKNDGAAIIWTAEGVRQKAELLKILRALKISGMELDLLSSFGWMTLFDADVLPHLNLGSRDADSN